VRFIFNSNIQSDIQVSVSWSFET